MGLDSPNIHKMIHWKPPNDVEEYVQETGISGRDGECTIAVLYYGKSDGYSDKLSAEMKHYINNSVVCRRELLMSTFGDPSQVPKPSKLHLCCDICAKRCQCGHCTNIIASLQLESVDLCELAETESLSPPGPKRHVPKAVWDAMKHTTNSACNHHNQMPYWLLDWNFQLDYQIYKHCEAVSWNLWRTRSNRYGSASRACKYSSKYY